MPECFHLLLAEVRQGPGQPREGGGKSSSGGRKVEASKLSFVICKALSSIPFRGSKEARILLLSSSKMIHFPIELIFQKRESKNERKKTRKGETDQRGQNLNLSLFGDIRLCNLRQPEESAR